MVSLWVSSNPAYDVPVDKLNSAPSEIADIQKEHEISTLPLGGTLKFIDKLVPATVCNTVMLLLFIVMKSLPALVESSWILVYPNIIPA